MAPGAAHRAAVLAALAVYALSGTLLTLVNKVAIQLFPFTCLLLVLQNLVTLLLLALGAWGAPARLGPLPAITWRSLRQWVPLTCLFALMLFTSLEALKHVSAVTLVVLRNLTTAVVAVGELAFLRSALPPAASMSVAGMLLGAITYGASDLTFSAVGYGWLAINVAASSAYQVYVKVLARQDGLTPMGMAWLNNAISVPMLLACGAATREAPGAWLQDHRADGAAWALLIGSGVLGYLLSTSAFALNQLISATSIMVANNSSKFAVILLSEAFLQRSLGPTSTAGAARVLWFAFLYTRDSKAAGHKGASMCGAYGARAAGLLCAGLVLTAAMLDLPSAMQLAAGRQARVHALSPSGRVRVSPTTPAISDSAEFAHCAAARASPAFRTCDQRATQGAACNATRSTSSPAAAAWAARAAPPASAQPFNGLAVLGLPDRTARNESVVEVLQRALRAAWGRNPPRVDLFVRTGCQGAAEAQLLFASVDVFWPRFLGEVVVVLDHADRNASAGFVPARPNHSYRLAYEHVPCMPGRIFNQVSYMMADRHSSADFLVTIDSDCVFHSPVTPELLFRGGRVRLPHSRAFQRGMWDRHVEFFLGAGTFQWHTMVTQPVTFHRATLEAFRGWFQATRGRCYLDAVADFAASGWDPAPFCWMCQLGTWLSATNITAERYDLVDLDADQTDPYQRLAVHTTYETNGLGSVEEASRAYVLQGVCRVLRQSGHVPACASVGTTQLDQVTFSYASWAWPGPAGPKAAQLGAYLGRLHALVGDGR